MTTKVKTTVTFTFTFESESEDRAIYNLRSWFAEQTDDKVQLVKDSDSGVYTYLNTNCCIGRTFMFNTSAEFIKKFCNIDGVYIPVRAMLDHSNSEGVTAKVDTIEVEEEEEDK